MSCNICIWFEGGKCTRSKTLTKKKCTEFTSAGGKIATDNLLDVK
jgi:hypothetical protein